MKYELSAKRLQAALANTHMKPQELANRSGVSKSSISQYVNDAHVPSVASSQKMGNILHVNPLWLMGFDVDMQMGPSSERTEEGLIYKFSMLSEQNKKVIIDMMDAMLSAPVR